MSLDVKIEPLKETVWLSSNQMATLFETTVKNIYIHIKNIYDEGEISNSVVKDSLPTEKELFQVATDGKSYLMYHHSKQLIDELVHIFLDNSLKYTSGEDKVSGFEVINNKNKIELRFSNSIDKDDELDEKQMMDRFYRSPSNKKDGSGIGLSIAQEIISLHKGNIIICKNDNNISFVITI